MGIVVALRKELHEFYELFDEPIRPVGHRLLSISYAILDGADQVRPVVFPIKIVRAGAG